jgi:spore germination protein YaaH
MNLDVYYNLDKYNENSIPLLMDTQLLENKAYEIDGKVYVEQSIVSTMIDSKIYWDIMAKKVLIATPDSVITLTPDATDVDIDGKKTSSSIVPLKTVNGSEYAVSLDYIKDHVNVEYEVYDNPKRVVIKCGWGNTFVKVKATKDDVLRCAADKKSEILVDVKKGDVLDVLTENVQSYMRYIKVMTKDGVIGYVLNKNIGKVYEEVLQNDYKGPEYTQFKMDKKVNLGWLQVSNMTANNGLRNLVSKTKGLNVVCPTWFTLADNQGGVTSYASKNFVTYAHNQGIKVWALVDDFSQTVKLMDIISNTEVRTKFIDNLIAKTLECGADGINVDFEHITEESSVHYIQFLRELRIKCHKKKLVISVDSYVPLSYNAHYNIDEQGQFVDYVVIMAYDEHHSKSTESGSVASISYTDTAIKKSLEKVPKERLIISVPFYSRLWGEKNGVIDSVETLGMQEAIDRVAKEGGKFNWDETTKQQYAEYAYNGKTCKIWLENKESINEKLALIMQVDVAGVGSWRVGYETSDIWNVISTHLTNSQSAVTNN